MLIDVCRYKFWQIGHTRTNTWSVYREAIVRRSNILESMVFLNSLWNQHCWDSFPTPPQHLCWELCTFLLFNKSYFFLKKKKKRNQHRFDVKTWQVHDNKNIVSLTNLEAKILITYQSIKQWFKEVVTSRIKEAVF